MAKKREEEHENHERWLVSYADFITLLFAFFVVMYSISRVDNKKLQQTASSIKWALHMEGQGGSTRVPVFKEPEGAGIDLGEGHSGSNQIRPAVEQLRQRIERQLGPLLVDHQAHVAVDVEGMRLTIRLGAAHFFDPGQAALRPEALPVLDAVVGELKPLNRPLRVEGHSDAARPQGGRFQSNWELSAARAATVAAYLEEAHHWRPELLSAVGRASTHPLASDQTAEGREANRRIELAIELGPTDQLTVAEK